VSSPDDSDSTSSNVSEISIDSSASDSDSDDEDEEKMQNGSKSFDANSTLPPVPNGTLDLSIPQEKQRFSSDEER
jgi:hypothetical protein